jgi:hypothetical protein
MNRLETSCSRGGNLTWSCELLWESGKNLHFCVCESHSKNWTVKMRCSHDAHPDCQILFCGPVNGMTDQLQAQQQAACWWPQLPIKPTATIYSHRRRSSVSRERSYEHWYALHCIVCNNIMIKGLRQVCKNLHTLSPSNSPSDTHPLTTKYTCKGGFKFQVWTCVCWFWVLAWFRSELGWFQLVFTGFGF